LLQVPAKRPKGKSPENGLCIISYSKYPDIIGVILYQEMKNHKITGQTRPKRFYCPKKIIN
jgi:hypothetical protein